MGWSVKLLHSPVFAVYCCCLNLFILLSMFHLSNAQNATTDPSEGTYLSQISWILQYRLNNPHEGQMVPKETMSICFHIHLSCIFFLFFLLLQSSRIRGFISFSYEGGWQKFIFSPRETKVCRLVDKKEKKNCRSEIYI